MAAGVAHPYPKMNQIIDITPAPTRKKHRREGARWSRSGCLTCKKRRKRCDEAKPRCNNCARLGKTCEGYGSMWAEPLDPFARVFQPTNEGQKRRRISSSASPSNSGFSDTNTTSSALSVSPCSSTPSSLFDDNFSIDSLALSSASSQPEESNDSPTNTPISIITPHISNLASLEAHYLQYHVEQGSKLLANLENDENPLRSLIIPRAFTSPLLMKSMCALSAMHLANRSHDNFDAKTAATNYYIQTMKGLRTALEECPDGGVGFPDDAILAVGLLVKYEIVRGSVKQWAVHLDALQKLVISRGGYASLDRDTAEFIWGLYASVPSRYQMKLTEVTSFMYAHNVAKITNRRYVTGTIPGADCIHLTKLDIYIGYTEDIIKICARIADLPSLRSDLLDMEVNEIDESLRTWTHTARQYIIPQGITPANLLRLQMVAECFRDAAYMYLHSMLERMNNNNNNNTDKHQYNTNMNMNTPSSPPCPHQIPMAMPISTSKPEALHRCLSRIASFNLDPRHCEYSALTFPLFIAGCECHEKAEREVVMRSLGRLEENFGIGNVKRAKELLGVLWDQHGKEMHWLDVLEGMQWDLILA